MYPLKNRYFCIIALERGCQRELTAYIGETNEARDNLFASEIDLQSRERLASHFLVLHIQIRFANERLQSLA